MTSCIFLGPSAPLSDAKRILPTARFLPPLQQGDLTTVVEQYSPTCVGIIDGYFQQRPSVWHKEILWALSNGIHVFGAASMGALRAAELETFGMVGIGKVFEGFRDGALPPFDGLNDDDEVAVMHGPKEVGYLAVTDALVNIRFTLDAAKLAGVISQQSSDAILQQASSLHFSMRSFSNVLKSLRDANFDSNSLDSFEQWLPGGKVDQKRADALLLLEHLKTLERLPVPAYAPDFHFETTEIWSGALLQSQAEARRAAPLSAKSQAILEQLQKDQSVFESVKESALLRLFMKQFSAFAGSTLSDSSDTNFVDDVSRQRVRQKIDEFRRQHNLWDREAINNWLHDNDVELMRFESLMHHEAWLDDLMQEPLSPGLQSAIIDYLRVSGDYSTLSEQLCDRALTDPA